MSEQGDSGGDDRPCAADFLDAPGPEEQRAGGQPTPAPFSVWRYTPDGRFIFFVEQPPFMQ